MEFNANNYCRLCLKTSKECDLKDKQEIKQEIINVLTKLFEISLENEDLSSRICTDCLSTIQNVSDYIDIVKENQEKLNSVKISVELELETFIKVEEFLIKTENVDEPICHNEVQSPLPIVEPKTAPRYFECDICSQTFKRKIFLAYHMNKFHTALLPHECELCKKRFISEKYLKNHVSMEHSDGLLNITNYTFCELCHDKPSFPTWEEMNEHYLENHQIQGYVKCCSRKFSRRHYFLGHLRMHNAPQEFMCVVCKKVLARKTELKKHMTLHLPEEEKSFQCEQCEKRYHLKSQLELHVKNVHGVKISVSCDICHKIFASRITFNCHYRQQHLKATQEMCPYCAKTCKTKADMQTHIKGMHTNIPKQTCPICGATVKNLQYHMRIHKEKNMNLICDICGFKTHQKSRMNRHMVVHMDVKPFVCKTCGNSFKRKKNLDDHMSQHTKIPGHFCNYCDRTFNNSGNKAKHIKQAHPLEFALNHRKNR